MNKLFRTIFFNLAYLGDPRWDTGISPPELLDYLNNHPPGRVLDLGCGTGTNALTLAQAGWQVTGVDYAVLAIQAARRKLKQAGLKAELWVGDATRMAGIDGPFDLILDIGCFHGLAASSQARYRKNLIRWLANDGHFLLYAHRLHPDEGAGRHGLNEEEIDRLAEHLFLVKREDSLDRFGRPSSWLTFRKPVENGAVQ